MISVVIPAFNEEKLLSQCLLSLVHQQTTRLFEVIVVDNGSTDETVSVAANFIDQLNLQVIREPRKGRGQARCTGFSAAWGNIILSTDADTIVSPEWIERMCCLIESGRAVAVAGPVAINDCGVITNFIFNVLQPVSAVLYRILFSHYWLPGFNFAIRRDIYHLSGGFDPTMDALEDNDLSWRVTKLGKIVFVPRLSVIFSGRRFKRRLLRGLWEHVVAFGRYYLGGVKRIQWSDIR